MEKATNKKRLDDVFFTNEQFNKELNSCLDIVAKPNINNKYYLCEHISASLTVSFVRVYIID